jgi:uncharacterized protein (DUF2126 family)
METDNAFELAVLKHDACVAELGLSIWVGSEPTFTDREAQTPAWLHAALGDDKEARARDLFCDLSRQTPGGLLLRSVGRLYPGEKLPRWSLGLLRRRDGAPVWRGPPDPMLHPTAVSTSPEELSGFAAALAEALSAKALPVQCAKSATQDNATAGSVSASAKDAEPQWPRFVLHLHTDAVVSQAEPIHCAAIEFPALESVGLFFSALSCIESAAMACRLHALVFTGAAPPVDETVELTTVTPDPAVIEINTAPSKNCMEFLGRSTQVYAAAAAQGLSAYRLYFNGQVADSGGAGQITFGGATPEASLFVRNPRLLPRLVCFLNRHPALSYLFSHDFVGGSGQSVRPDERGTDAFDDLLLALTLLEREDDVSPELLWKALASFLCDAVGNSHRSEINIEKLWNPYLPGRGCLGLVEFRSLRMQHTPQRATAIACLLRAVIAMLASRPYDLPLIDWGRELHDRFALPFYLRADLDAVFSELESAGLGLEVPLQNILQQNEFRFFGKVELPFGTLALWRGLEFWPLVGDAASPEQSGSSRMVDASTTRIEVRWLPPSADMPDNGIAPSWRDWSLYAGETRLPMRDECDNLGELKVFGVRYRSFVPRSGLHPTRKVQAPLTLTLRHPDHPTQYVVQLHEWHPEGLAYSGLPKDLSGARDRRAERMTVVEEKRARQPDPLQTSIDQYPGQPGLTNYSLDLRYR